MNKETKLISYKSLLYINCFKALQGELDFLIEKSKNSFYSKLPQTLPDKISSSETYWSILKSFLNDQKILCTLPVFHENRFVIDFREKAELFNNFFCTAMFTTKE